MSPGQRGLPSSPCPRKPLSKSPPLHPHLGPSSALATARTGTLDLFVYIVITNLLHTGTSPVRLVQCVPPVPRKSVTVCRMNLSVSSSVNWAQRSLSGRAMVATGGRGSGHPRAPHPRSGTATITAAAEVGGDSGNSLLLTPDP